MNVAVIPAYCEEKTIGEVAKRTKKFVDRVIVVDDCSTDNTFEEAKKACETVVRHEKNKGKAQALKTGFELIGDCDVVVILDGDLQHLPEEIPALLKCIEDGADLCIGSRFLGDSNCMPLSNRISNKIASTLLSVLAGQKVTDSQSGFRAIKREALEQLELPADRYAVEHIMILEAAKKGFKITETPISCIYGGEKSHINPAKDTANVIYHILRFILR
ncbi:glycosyltransferase family 2 protein [archaeon]|nr:glycosyltransferase family 2 protein [archaeon]